MVYLRPPRSSNVSHSNEIEEACVDENFSVVNDSAIKTLANKDMVTKVSNDVNMILKIEKENFDSIDYLML